MIGRTILAFTATIAACLGIAWLRGGLDRTDLSSNQKESSGPREVTLAISGMH
jgi:hypothetical protein